VGPLQRAVRQLSVRKPPNGFGKGRLFLVSAQNP
jgi:hypothetical protein